MTPATDEHPGSSNRSVRVAVVGSGPAGFYTTDALIKQRDVHFEVDLFERLAAPYGLVRYGVAPDHQKIKSVTTAYDKVAQDPRVRFLGNVHVGKDVSVEELLTHYDQVVFAVGCQTDRRLGIPGEELPGSHAATSFVAWYNGHPDFREYPVNLDVERAAIVGMGDVAMDLTRMLLQPVEELARTDVANHALDVFRGSRVREVVLLGRRGPAQAAFATKELEDIACLPDVTVSIDAAQVRADREDENALDGLTKRKLDFLSKLAGRPSEPRSKQVRFRFLVSPVEITAANGRVSGIVVEHNEVVRDASGRVSARGTGQLEAIPVGLVFRSVGYRGVPIVGLPFDETKGIVPNRDGRVVRDGTPVPHVYVSGWIKRGPSGVIGTNKSDAAATVQRMVEDARGDGRESRKTRDAFDALLRERGIRVVSWKDWQTLDRIERERGKSAGKVREKLTLPSDVRAALGDHGSG